MELFKSTTKIGAAATFFIPFNKRLGLYSELAFVQRGMYYRFEGPSYLRLPNYQNQGELFFKGHNRVHGMNISNGYLEIPALFYFKPIENRLHLEFGPSVAFLVSSRAMGTIKYTDPDHPNNIVEMDLNYRYMKDELGATASTFTNFGTALPSGTRTGRIDGTTISYPQSIGAYYFNSAKDGSYFRVMDFGLNLGASFYFTPGVRVGARAYYGLMDVSNNFYDESKSQLDANDQPVKRSDFDRNFGVQLFIGLQFN
jgi:hypothetical protein